MMIPVLERQQVGAPDWQTLVEAHGSWRPWPKAAGAGIELPCCSQVTVILLCHTAREQPHHRMKMGMMEIVASSNPRADAVSCRL